VGRLPIVSFNYLGFPAHQSNRAEKIRVAQDVNKAASALVNVGLLQIPRICSLSAAGSDVKMWSLYAEGHAGISFEFDFTSPPANLHEVSYSHSLPHLPGFGSILTTERDAIPYLKHKTTHWSYEQEHRLVSHDEYADVTGRLRRIILGFRASELLELVFSRIFPSIPINRANLEKDSVGLKIRD